MQNYGLCSTASAVGVVFSTSLGGKFDLYLIDKFEQGCRSIDMTWAWYGGFLASTERKCMKI